ncbi:MAG TPA: S1-like domain-containing RNA-binding protein [Bacteroidales bacterium]|nr:S1-like domain-containing RNA-binding protein [Bacteroidales bacterium]
MPFIGKYNTLKIVKELDFGVYLDGAELGEILLPRRYVPLNFRPGDEVEVFLYFDSDDRIIATTEKPRATVGEFALMRVKSVDKFGAFMDWGLMKDLLVPFREQKVNMVEGRSYIVHVFIDKRSNRIAGSAKLEQFLDRIPPEYEPGQQVELLIWQATDMGYKAIVNHFHQGMLYANEVFQKLNVGQTITGYVKKIREDQKIDLSLYPIGYAKVGEQTDPILAYLEKEGGFAPLTDKTPPDEIYSLFGVSKKTFKRAIGALYKDGKILIQENGISLVKI